MYHVTAENIEAQMGMTQNIQSAIEDTKEHSDKMLSIAITSNEENSQNQNKMIIAASDIFEMLRQNIILISATTEEVTASAEQTNTLSKENVCFASIYNIIK